MKSQIYSLVLTTFCGTKKSLSRRQKIRILKPQKSGLGIQLVPISAKVPIGHDVEQ